MEGREGLGEVTVHPKFQGLKLDLTKRIFAEVDVTTKKECACAEQAICCRGSNCSLAELVSN